MTALWLFAAGILLGAAAPAGAVPAYQRLYQSAHRVTHASCLVCHTGGAGGKLNDYGKAFFRAGAHLKAFEAIGAADADGDGATSAAEIAAGSNPGDPASTPKTPGGWLASSRLEDTVPLDELAEFFPKAKRFEVKHLDLAAADLEALASAGGGTLADEDRFPTLYFPLDESGASPVRAGVALFRAESRSDGLLLTAVAVLPDGTVLKAWGQLLRGTGRDSLRDLARQIAGKPIDAPLKIGSDLKPVKGKAALSEAGARAFRISLALIRRTLGAS